MPGKPDVFTWLQPAHEFPIRAEQTPVHRVDGGAAVVAPGLGVGDSAAQGLLTHFDEEIIGPLLLDEQDQLAGEARKVYCPFTAGVESHAGFAQLVVEDDGIHRVFAGNPVGVPGQHQLELPLLGSAEQGRQTRAGIRAAVAGDGFVGKPLDNGESFAGSQFGDFGTLFGRAFVLLTARHADVAGRGDQFCDGHGCIIQGVAGDDSLSIISDPSFVNFSRQSMSIKSRAGPAARCGAEHRIS